jgi:glycosyltransferase involved in cell wall biosynthesis
MELTILMPCLNEAETLGRCVEKAQRFLASHGVEGEVVVADNGSTDGSQALAEQLGARVVAVQARGYGAALMGGSRAAKGRFIVMGDSDDSYDFSALTPFLEALRGGADLVMGNRFRGGIAPGAMPFKNRYLGNPVLTGIGKALFGTPVGDFHCGLRGYSKAAFEHMALVTTGMEFASEMVIKATLLKLKVVEVPTTLAKDGRSRPPHLRPWRDGWRHLRFMLLYSPRWLFLYPGLALMLLGAGLLVALIPGGVRVGPLALDVHTMLFASAMVVIGLQLVLFAAFARVLALREGLAPESPGLNRVFQYINLEVGLLAGGFLMAVGLGGSLLAVWRWRQVGFGALDPEQMLRLAIPSVTSLTGGVEMVTGAFFLSMLGLRTQGGAASPRP